MLNRPSKLSITLIFDDDTQVRLEGDSKPVLALIRTQANDVKGFIKHDYYMMDRTEPETHWDLNALAKLLSQEEK